MQATIARRTTLKTRRVRVKAKAKAKGKASKIRRIKPLAVILPAKAVGKTRITSRTIVLPKVLRRTETKIKRERKEEKVRKVKAKARVRATGPDLSRHQVAGQPSATNGTKRVHT